MNSTTRLFWNVFRFQLRCDAIYYLHRAYMYISMAFEWFSRTYAHLIRVLWYGMILQFAFAFIFSLKCFIPLLLVWLFVNFLFKWKLWWKHLKILGVVTYIFHLFGVFCFSSMFFSFFIPFPHHSTGMVVHVMWVCMSFFSLFFCDICCCLCTTLYAFASILFALRTFNFNIFNMNERKSNWINKLLTSFLVLVHI